MLLFKGVWLTVAVVHLSTAGTMRYRRFTPTDAFITGELENAHQKSNQMTTLGPMNSAEILSAEIGSQAQQQNSAEVVTQGQQQNSVEVSTTLNPTNSAEVISLPQNIEKPSASGGQQTVASSSNAGTDQNGNSNTSPGSSTIDGTQPFFPQASSIPNQDASGATPSKAENTVNAGSAPGTQPISHPVKNDNVLSESENTPVGSENTENVNGAPETHQISPQVTNVEAQEDSENTQVDTQNTANVGSAPGTQPFFPVIQNSIAQADNANTPAESENTATAGSAPKTQSISDQEGANTPAESGSADNVAGVSETQAFSNSHNVGNEPSQFHNNANRIPGFESISVLDSNLGGSIFRTPGVQPITSDKNVPSRLRDALTQVGVEDTVSNPIVDEAKQYFISIWNLEAHRLGAPYLEVTDVWPEIGMVYMPTINQMSSKIQSSRPVKEAAERLKAIWAENNPSPDITSEDKNYITSLLSEFLNFLGLESFRYEQRPISRDDLNVEPQQQVQPSYSNPSFRRPVQSFHPVPMRPNIRGSSFESRESEESFFDFF